MTLDVLVKKEFPVQVDWVGKLPANLRLVDAKLTPGRVQVIGGSKILKNISTIYTEKVPLNRKKKSGTMTVKVALNHPSLKITSPSKDKIIVEFVVKERLQ